MNAQKENTQSRMATIDMLIKTTVPLFISPVPCRGTLRNWFDAAKIPRFKANPSAKRGGGPAYYSVAAVEKYLQGRIVVIR